MQTPGAMPQYLFSEVFDLKPTSGSDKCCGIGRQPMPRPNAARKLSTFVVILPLIKRLVSMMRRRFLN